MAELGVISSIIGIACLGVKLSKHLYHFGENTVSANHNINRIATNITLFSSMLKHVGTVMSDTKSLHTPEALETAKQIVNECEIVFGEIGRIIDTSIGGAGESKNIGLSGVTGIKRRMSIMTKVKFHFEQPKVDWLLAQLEYLKTTLSVLIQTLHLAAVASKLEEQNKSIQEYRESVNQEKLHIETLIFARQLSVIILNQQQQQHTQGAEKNDSMKNTGRVSPANSEVSVDDEIARPKLLKHESDSSLTLVTRGSGHLDFLDNVITNDDHAFSPVTNKLHDQVIDQLLSRWTTLPAFTIETYNQQGKQQEVEGRPLVIDSSEEESTVIDEGPRDPSPLVKPSQSSRNITVEQLDSKPKENDTTIEASSSTPSQKTDDTRLGPPPNASVPRRLNRTPSPRFPLSQGPPPNSTLENPPNLQTNKKPPPTRVESVPESPLSFDVTSSYASDIGSIYASPRPLTRTTSMASTVAQTSSYPPPMPPMISRDTTSTLDMINEGYNNRPRPLSHILSPTIQTQHPPPLPPPPPQSQTPRNQYQAHLSPASSTRSSFSEDDTQIPWRIIIGPRYWDFIDSDLHGPRTPDLPSEPLSWLYNHDNANTEITDTWVDEEALMEKRYPYMRVQPSRDLKSSDEVRWRILCPLRFEEIRALVQRTNMLERIRSQRPMPGPIQSQRPRSNSDVRTHPFQPAPQPQSGYFPTSFQQPQPPPQTSQDNSQRTTSSNPSIWQQQQSYTTLSPTGPNSLQRQQPQQQQQPRTVSFGGMNEIPLQQPRGMMKSVSSDRSPHSSQDLSNQSYPPPPQQQQQQQQQQMPQGGYWLGQGPPVTSPGPMPYPPGAPQYPQYNSPAYSQQSVPNQWSYPPSNASQQQRWDPQGQLRRNDRDRDRNRDARSDSESSESSRERERRRREKKHEKGRKKRGRASAAAAGTLGGIGGLAALLEGLDGL